MQKRQFKFLIIIECNSPALCSRLKADFGLGFGPSKGGGALGFKPLIWGFGLQLLLLLLGLESKK